MNTCPHPDCGVQIFSSTLFACRNHWFSLPRSAQREIWRNYRSGDMERILEGYEKAEVFWDTGLWPDSL